MRSSNRPARVAFLLALSLTVPAARPARAGAPADGQTDKNEPVILDVDASEAPRKILHAKLVIPAAPGRLTLLYPKWIPGEHGPTGPITDLAGLKISAGGKDIAWHRDEEDWYALRCEVPDGAKAIEVSLDFLAPTATTGFTNAASSSAKLVVVNWNQVLLYPKGRPARDLVYRASLTLPTGWKLGTALPVVSQKDARTDFKPVSLEELIDSPVIAGAHFRQVPLGPPDGPSHFLEIACDSPEGLEMSPAMKGHYDRLVAETGALYGVRHYRSYHFLLALSDRLPHFGLEHHESSDNRAPERSLIDDNLSKVIATLLPHEFTHSWNGKYRRPADMVTPDFQRPQRTKLLWVYEGLTQYLCVVLAARSGLWTPGQARDWLAYSGDGLQNQRGRNWRPLEDTTVAAHLLYYAPTGWAARRRGVDFYDEGVFLWLEVDAIIRQQTKGKRSLDDFCRRFFGGKGGAPSLKPFTFDDLVADLNAVAPYDWKALLTRRVGLPSEKAPLDGLYRSGWRIGYSDKSTGIQTATESAFKMIDLRGSIGLVLQQDGTVQDVVPGKAADRAGVGPGMKLVAVNTRRWSATVLSTAIAGTRDGGSLELLLENGDFFKTYPLRYSEGAKYPRLERGETKEDLLSEILKPLTPKVAEKKTSERKR